MKATTAEHHKYTNHLIDENSPYLLAHAHNPVNWYPWGEEALGRAKSEDKPIFLSIGYAACHWCHVMERESFENESIAAVLNDNYICIKVDREQRPDLDEIYMAFTTTMTGHGGWPMSVFLTSDLQPFFAGTYFPPEDRYGRPGFMKVISKLAEAYQSDRSSVVASANGYYDKVSRVINRNVALSVLRSGMVADAANGLMRSFDHTHGGFGSSPKFPHAMELSLFLRQYKRDGEVKFLKAAEKALKAMARGGIFDQAGGGFARYSTDARWLVPHFEKMLYDNALLVTTYADAYRITGDPLYLTTVRRTLDFILSEMTDKTGGYYSALDADSEGEEGKFYVWSKSEIVSILGDRAEPFNSYFNVSARGNFEGHNILNLDESSDEVRRQSSIADFDAYLDDCLKKLMKVRAKRIRPLTDDKILTSWNGLALSALCQGYQITGDRKYLDAAIKNGSFVQEKLNRDGNLTHSYREGRHSNGLFLEDYAYYIRGLLDLYESDLTNNDRWLKFAEELATKTQTNFFGVEGHYYLRPDGQADLLIRPRNETDGALPSPGSIMIGNLLKLNRITEKKSYLVDADKALKAVSGLLAQAPGSMATAALALDYLFGDKIEVVIVGDGSETISMVAEVYRRYTPGSILAVQTGGNNSDSPLFEGRSAPNGESLAFVCRNSVCRLPVSTNEELRAQLDSE